MLKEKIYYLKDSKNYRLEKLPSVFGGVSNVVFKLSKNDCKLSFIINLLDELGYKLQIVDSGTNEKAFDLLKSDTPELTLGRARYTGGKGRKKIVGTAAGKKIPIQEKDD